MPSAKSAKRVVLLTSASPSLGQGHASRCRVLGRWLGETNATLLFYKSAADYLKFGEKYFTTPVALLAQLRLSAPSVLVLDGREIFIPLLKPIRETLPTCSFIALDLDPSKAQAQLERYLDYLINALPNLHSPLSPLLPLQSPLFSHSAVPPHQEKNTLRPLAETEAPLSLTPNLAGLSFLPPFSNSKKRIQKRARTGKQFQVLIYLGSFVQATYCRAMIEMGLKSLIHFFTTAEKKISGTLRCVCITNAPLSKTVRTYFATAAQRTSVLLGRAVKQEVCFFETEARWETRLSESALFLTHFGLSAYSALASGLPTLLSAPTAYHLRLARRHFPQLTVTPKTLAHQLPPSYSALKQLTAEVADAHSLKDLGKNWKQLGAVVLALGSYRPPTTCAVCGTSVSVLIIVKRRPTYNLYQCGGKWGCGSYFISKLGLDKTLALPKVKYTKDYFLAEYQRTYQKTYAADEARIKQFCRQRLRWLRRLWQRWGTGGEAKKAPERFLEIGSAYGYFLDVVKESGYSTEGIEISSHAARRARRNHLVHQGDFLNPALEKQLRPPYEVIAMWYVIEHFETLPAVLARLARLQQKGGWVALSTPNAKGFSARFEPEAFLKTSPEDHYFIFSPSGLQQALNQYGYTLRKKQAGGIHFSRFQKRFPSLRLLCSSKVYGAAARALSWGDTMELYFQKTR